VKVGPYIHVAGTTAVDGKGGVVGVGDPYAQAVQCLRIIEAALAKGGATMDNVVRTRVYLVDVSHWEAVGKAHGEVFKNVRPASTMLAVARLIGPELLVEIEADAYVG
jgi:enamine deaminase RidA (YjgF/YER057c/UK114 family)